MISNHDGSGGCAFGERNGAQKMRWIWFAGREGISATYCCEEIKNTKGPQDICRGQDGFVGAYGQSHTFAGQTVKRFLRAWKQAGAVC